MMNCVYGSSGVFHPPPKVDSGVLVMHRKTPLPPLMQSYAKIVKTSFQQRRKTIRNSLKTLGFY